MARMTEEEAWALDDFVTSHEIELGPNGSGWLTQREIRLMGLSTASIKYLMTRSQADNTSPAAIINELVQKEMAASV